MFAIKTVTLGLVASSLLFSACGNKHEAPIFPEEPDAGVTMVLNAVAAGNGSVLWDALPATYQSDVNTLAQLMGSRLDAQVYDKSFVLLGQLAAVLEQQQAFIFNTSKLSHDAESLTAIQQALPALVGVLQTLAHSPAATLEGLKTFDGQAFFGSTVSDLLAHGMKLAEFSKSEEGFSLQALREAQVRIVSTGEETAILEFSMPGQSVELAEFSKIENRWLPLEMSQGWAAAVAQMKAQLDALTLEALNAQKPQIMGIMTMLEGVLGQMASAETQPQFDQALQGAMMPLFGLIMLGQQQLNSVPAPAAPVAPAAH